MILENTYTPILILRTLLDIFYHLVNTVANTVLLLCGSKKDW